MWACRYQHASGLCWRCSLNSLRCCVVATLTRICCDTLWLRAAALAAPPGRAPGTLCASRSHHLARQPGGRRWRACTSRSRTPARAAAWACSRPTWAGAAAATRPSSRSRRAATPRPPRGHGPPRRRLPRGPSGARPGRLIPRACVSGQSCVWMLTGCGCRQGAHAAACGAARGRSDPGLPRGGVPRGAAAAPAGPVRRGAGQPVCAVRPGQLSARPGRPPSRLGCGAWGECWWECTRTCACVAGVAIEHTHLPVRFVECCTELSHVQS